MLKHWTAVLAGCLLGATAVAAPATAGTHAKPRTVVTTDMEQDDYASLIRYLLYTNDVDTQGIVYTSSRFHWAGDGRGTEFFLPGREYTTPQTSWRWTGTRTIQDEALRAYGRVHPNLVRHDRDYPSARSLLAKVRVGNIAFEGDMAHDTPGSDLIRDLLLDRDPRPLYLQAWGGTNTIARALKSIEDDFGVHVKERVSRKAVILASGFQDETYASYIAPHWPGIRVEELSAGYATWGYNCDRGQGNTRGPLFSGAWIRKNIQIGPYGRLYRSWLDGQAMPGDPLDIFGDPEKAPGGWCKPLAPYDFLSEGDNVAFNPLLDTGIQAPDNPALGGWGGRAERTGPNLWTLVPAENGIAGYTTRRWADAAQNDFAARMSWTLTPRFRAANHAPTVTARPASTTAQPGATVRLTARTSDPDRDHLTTSWWHYREEGTYPGAVAVSPRGVVTVPADARRGQTISVIVQATDDGEFPLTRYDRVIITVR
ncbi:nucleoside hydrolase-like domain-containing protein [Symbioplanes lichenis]|uniref:nucleoside hydrolase-like domain-containing protein n=1 Tax=Symbioplanes lichenis TaxID=1629072 RepID=UPI0027390957|nr:nucleoside hydrolase-like domain-containing protein [Actinoplanes lichenis]